MILDSTPTAAHPAATIIDDYLKMLRADLVAKEEVINLLLDIRQTVS
jgi:hypothetical protein